jgi:pectin lyase
MKSHLLQFFILLFWSFGTSQAATRSYPVSEVNFGAYNTTYNLNVTGLGSGSPLNIYAPTGNENEDWRINYISAGVYEIENSTTGTFITAGTNNVAQIATLANNTAQRWQIVGVTKDFLGEYLYYKIINVGNGKALTYSGTTVILADYSGANNQLWRLDLDGLEGFAALCKVKEGIHASTIGGLLGPTVYVSTIQQYETAITDLVPKTIVVTANMDASALGRDIKVGSYKTVIGSFAANTINDLRMRTNSYGYRTNNSDVYRAPSDNIVFKNMTFSVSKVKDQIVFGAYSSKNIWLDHNTFYSTLDNNVGEVGKFVWINTPYDGADLTRSPDFITGSYNICRNRYWCWVYGTQNGVTSEDRTTIAFTYWDNNIRRQPEIGNGTLHTYNNFHIRTNGSSDNGALAAMIVDGGSTGYSEGSLFLNFRRESTGYWDSEILAGADREFIDIGSYSNKTTSGDPNVLPTPWKNSVTNLPMTWKPSQYYSYKKLSGYNSNGVGDAKAFILKYSGSQSSMPNFKYITDTDVSSYVTQSFGNPFLITPRTTPKTYVYQYNTTVADDAWESTSNWTPSEIPTAIDTAIIRTGEVKVYSDLGTFIKVEPNGIFRLIGNYSVPSIQLQGGTVKVFTSSTTYGLTSNIEVQKASTIMAGSLAASIFWLKGTLSGNGDLTKTSVGILDLNVDASDYTGNWIVSEGVLRIANSKSIGKNTVTVSSGATLEIAASNVTISKVILGTGVLALTNNLSVSEISIKGVALAPGKYTASNYPGSITGSGTLTVLGVPDCAGVLNGTATLDNCSRCIGGTSGKTACTSAGEAETAACAFDGVTENKNEGYKGTSYINVDNAVGTAISFNVSATNAGTATISFRYANGGTVDRPAQISLNGTILANTLSFPVTGTFTDWKAVDITLTLIKGINAIKLISSTAEGLANIDQIGYVSTGVSTGSCIITGLGESESNQQISIYPNPSKSTFYVNASNPEHIQVVDMEGKVYVEHRDVTNVEFGENLKSGIYFLKIGNKAYKLVKE